MSEADAVAASPAPLTVDTLAAELRGLGLSAGQRVLLHSALSRLGWVAGGAVAVIQALLRVLGPGGTLMVPTHTSDNSEPSRWQDPPVPAAWWPQLRAHLPAFDPALTPSRGMGRIAEALRTWPGARRSDHPVGSFAALGPAAPRLLADRLTLPAGLEEIFGESSPLARLYELDGLVLLLGVGHECNTSLHLAEHRARWPGKATQREGAALMVDGARRWVEYDMLTLDTDDFPAIGQAFEATQGITPGRVGQAAARLLRQRPLVDFAASWMSRHR